HNRLKCRLRLIWRDGIYSLSPKGGAGYSTRPERLHSGMMFSTTSQSKRCDGVTYPVALRFVGWVASFRNPTHWR
ncbi:MAG: hypothetical protein WCK96_11165, partial [Methylococcales bacterium]